MKKITEHLNKYKIYLSDISMLRKGETSNTYVGMYKDKKVIIKNYKDINPKIKINSYLDYKIISQLVEKEIFPKVIFNEKETKILVYEFVEEILNKKNNKIISNLGSQIKKIHDILIEGRTYTFEDQIEKYKFIIGDKLKIDFRNLEALIFKSKQYSQEIKFSHNDLNKNNIIYNKKAYFIDYEYASLNNIFCDISKVIREYSFNDFEVDILLGGYGIKNSQTVKDQIKIWTDINTLLDRIWTELMSTN